jgi:Spy/CpxP family protein refolding chaperone
MEDRMMKKIVVASLFCMSLGLALMASSAARDDSSPGPLGLPSVDTLKFRLNLTDEQAKKCGGIYDEYKEKAQEIEKKSGDQRKSMRNEIVSKLKELMSENQKKKLDELVNDPQK